MSKDELLAMLPEWFQKIKEYPEIMAAWAYALSDLGNNIAQVWANQYIQTCDEATLVLYERLLGITPSGDETLEYRRAIVMNRYTMIVPFTYDFLLERLNEMFGQNGYVLTIDSANNTADIVITSSVARAKSIFLNFWYLVAPAHLEVSAREEAQSEIDGGQYFGGVVMSQVVNTF